MWNIAILEDDVACADKLKQHLYEYFDRKQMEIHHFDLFTDGASLLASSLPYDLLCLDIEVGKDNGIAIAKELRKRLPDVLIIVITSYIKYSMEGYKIQAARYLLKPVPKALLFSELEEVLSTSDHDSYVMIHDKEEYHRIRRRDIYYIESYGRKSKLYTKSEAFISEEAIGVWIQKLLPFGFCECYKGICVSLRIIEELRKDTLLLDNEKILPLARRREAQLRHAWIAYQEKLL